MRIDLQDVQRSTLPAKRPKGELVRVDVHETKAVALGHGRRFKLMRQRYTTKVARRVLKVDGLDVPVWALVVRKRVTP